jgi:hypothetical protein
MKDSPRTQSPVLVIVALLLVSGSVCCYAQTQSVSMPQYEVSIAASNQAGAPAQLKVDREHQTIFQAPIVAGLASSSSEEQLSDITYSLRKSGEDTYELDATARSSLWTGRRFQWRFFPDHIEFQQFAGGSGKLGRCYFLANGVSNRWDSGTTSGHAWDATIYADRYFAPNPNLADQFEFNIAMPQILGFSVGREESSEQDFRPERMAGTFAPPPLLLAFHMDRTWTGVGIGTKPGEYQFPALEYSGSRYAGATFYVDYMGYRSVDGGFASPVLNINMAYSALDALQKYTAWLTANGFATDPVTQDVYWHHLPIFCGWAEQTVESVPQGGSANKFSTQANYGKWLATLDERGLPVGTVVIDDKWQQGYGNFEVDQQKWPDMKGFIAAQHAKGRHVVLWVSVADTDGLPPSLCVNYQGKCIWYRTSASTASKRTGSARPPRPASRSPAPPSALNSCAASSPSSTAKRTSGSPTPWSKRKPPTRSSANPPTSSASTTSGTPAATSPR